MLTTLATFVCAGSGTLAHPLTQQQEPAAEPLATVPGCDWPRFRGPHGSGLAATHVKLPDQLQPETNLTWSATLAPGHSSPCVVGDLVVVTGCTGDLLQTYALDRRDGSLRWQREVQAPSLERFHEVNGPASPSPTGDGQHIVVYFGSYGLLCYDIEGRELWQRRLPVAENTFGTAASPVFCGKKLIFLSDLKQGSRLEAINASDGTSLWLRERSHFGSGWSTPALWSRAGVEELLVLGVWWLTAYDLHDGRELWSVPGLTDEPITTPVTGAGLVFTSSYNMKVNPEVQGLPSFADCLALYDDDGDGSLDAAEVAENKSVLSRPDADGEGDHPLSMFVRFLDVDRDGEITASEWQKLVAWVESWEHQNGLVAVRPAQDEAPAQIAWQFPRGVPECPSPLFYEGRIYSVMNGGQVTCLRAENGELIYQARLPGRGPYYSSLVAGDGKIYAGSARGVLSVIAAGDTFELRSSLDLAERMMATPALVDGAIFVRSETRLYCFSVTAQK